MASKVQLIGHLQSYNKDTKKERGNYHDDLRSNEH